MRVILLNGPRRVGKDTIADTYCNLSGLYVVNAPMMWPMKAAALALYGLAAHYVDVYEAVDLKDTPQERLYGRTPREVYIEYANKQRAQHGEGIYAQMWLKAAALIMHMCDEIIVSDVRFKPELDAAVKLVGGARVQLVCVHRKDHDWTGDVGSYQYLPGRTAHFHNNGERHNLMNDFTAIINRFEVVS